MPLVLLLFLSLHITIYLFFVEGESEYMVVMKLFRQVYRGVVVQPVLVALLLFQVASGLYLGMRRASAPMEDNEHFNLPAAFF